MAKYLTLAGLLAFVFMGCSLSTERCLAKEGFKNCEDFKAAAQKAQGNDEVYRFHAIAKKCHCEE